MKATPGPKARTPEWYALRKFDPSRERKLIFGATDAAPCCGMSPYRTPLDVFCENRGLVGPVEETDAMRMGRNLEPIVLDELEHRTGVALLRDLPLYFHPTVTYMAATPDALVVVDKDLEPQAGVDAKTTTYRRYDKAGLDPLKFGEEGTDQMPPDYVLQAQQQCAVLDLPYVLFPVLFDLATLRIYKVERNEELIQGIIKAELEMYERVLNDDPPEPNWEAEQTRSLISAVFGMTKGKSMDATAEMLELWAANQREKEQIKHLEEQVRVRSNKVLFLMQGAESATFPKGEKQIKQIVVKETKVSQSDVDDLQARVGQQKRAGYAFLKECKIS